MGEKTIMETKRSMRLWRKEKVGLVVRSEEGQIRKSPAESALQH